MIPLLGITTCNQFDVFVNLIKSINYPVETLSILVNSSINYFDLVREYVYSNPNPFIKQIDLAFCPQNMGCASSWNFHIKNYPSATYWVLCSGDVILGENDLKQLDEKTKNLDGCFADKNMEFVLFSLNRTIISKVGLFDENFHPGGYEDDDYRKRLAVSDAKIDWFDCGAYHVSGGTIKTVSSEQRNKLMYEISPYNEEYYNKKWGTFRPVYISDGQEKINKLKIINSESYSTPFQSNNDVTYWKYDVDERSRKIFRIVY
jgi:hypothetical protein